MAIDAHRDRAKALERFRDRDVHRSIDRSCVGVCLGRGGAGRGRDW